MPFLNVICPICPVARNERSVIYAGFPMKKYFELEPIFLFLLCGGGVLLFVLLLRLLLWLAVLPGVR